MDRPDQAQHAPEAAFSPFEDGVRALLDAKQLARTDDGVTSALLLCRAALRHLVRATLLDAHRIDSTSTEAELWQEGRLLPLVVQGADSMGWLAGAEAWFERFVVSPTGDLELAQVAKNERPALLAALLRLGFDLAVPLDRARNGAARAVRRRRRLAWLGGALLFAVVGLSLRCALAPVNLAFGRPVVVSAPDPGFALDPKGVVDGDTLTMGFHTIRGKDPSVTIDLGRSQRVSRIEIYNRVECCHDRIVPLTVQISRDGKKYKTILRETHTFTHASFRLPKKSFARYVRLVRSGNEVFHLAEVEIY